MYILKLICYFLCAGFTFVFIDKYNDVEAGTAKNIASIGLALLWPLFGLAIIFMLIIGFLLMKLDNAGTKLTDDELKEKWKEACLRSSVVSAGYSLSIAFWILYYFHKFVVWLLV